MKNDIKKNLKIYKKEYEEKRKKIAYKYLENSINIINFFETSEYEEIQNFKNINNISFYKQSSYKYFLKVLIGEGSINNKKIYNDPDRYDKKLYENICEKLQNGYIPNKPGKCKIQKKTNGNEITFSLDGIISWKAILDVCYNECESIKNFDNFEVNFIKLYNLIRNPENNGHLIWPSKGNTINTAKGNNKGINDRIDYTLEDIKNFFELKSKTTKKEWEDLKKQGDKKRKNFFEKNNLILKVAYANSYTFNWLDSFENFKDFIEEMNLKRWCNNDYEIIDLTPTKDDSIKINDFIQKIENNKEKKIYLKNKKDEIEKNTIQKDTKRQYSITRQYIENLVCIMCSKK